MPLIRKASDPAQAAAPSAGETAAALASSSPEKRWIAVRSVARDSSSVPLLARALAAETDDRVRQAIFTALERIGSTESAAVILPCLRSDDAGLRTGALDALRAMPDAVAAHLRRLLADPDADVRLLACDLARGLPNADAVRLLCAMLESEREANVCAAAVDVLAEIGDTSVLPSLTRCAERFPDDPFLGFATRTAADRLITRPASRV